MAFTPILGSGGYDVSTGGGAITPTGLTLRPDVVPGQACLNPNWDSNNPFAAPFINVNYFAAPGSLNNPRLGSSPRSLSGCRSPRMVSLNGSLMKRVYLGSERRYLQLQVDALNATNHPLFFFNPNSGRTEYGGFNTASITNPAVPAFALQSSFGMVWQPNSALMSRTALVSLRLFW